MNLPSKAVLQFSFLLFVLLLLHFVSSFPFLIYKQLVRKEVFPRRRLKYTNLRAPSSDFTVVERARSKFISESFESELNFDSSDEKEMILKQNTFNLVVETASSSEISSASLPRIWNFSELKNLRSELRAARELVSK